MGTEDVFTKFLNQVVDYLPSLVGGLLLMAIGWAVAWLVKRIVIQICVMLKLGRLLRRFRWAKGMSGADVRLSLYGVAGSVVALVVLLVFLDAAFTAMKLTVVSTLLEKTVLLFPRVLSALAIFGLGWLIAFWSSMALRRALRREEVPRAALISGYARTMVLLLFAAMAVAELDIAREVVVIGFTVIYITLGVLTIILTIVGGRGIMEKLTGSSAGEQD